MIKIAAIITAALALCACSGSLPHNSSNVVGATVGPATSSGYQWYSISYSGATLTQVTGIADDRDVVGVYASNGIYHSFTAKYHQNYSPLTKNDYPDDAGTFLTSIMASGGNVEAGYAISPGAENGTWGVIDNKGLWTLIEKYPGVGDCHMMEIFGIDTSYDAVGFYLEGTGTGTGSNCSTTQHAFEVQRGEHYKDLGQPLTDQSFPVATGIGNGTKLIVGYASNNQNAGPYTGWSEPKPGGTVTAWKCCSSSGAKSTQILGVNDEISGSSEVWAVGTYYSNSTWQGFILKNLTGTPTWQTQNYPYSATSTVISGIDKYGDICGWYTTGGETFGFVGINKATT